jgi:alkyl hydroperoxide reductase subunit AhpC
MLPATAGETADGRTAADNHTVRTVYVVGPDKKIKLTISYPMTTGRNFDDGRRVRVGRDTARRLHRRFVSLNRRPIQ